MDLQALLEAVAAGETTVEDARERIEGYTRVGDFARLDTGRAGRAGVPEIVLAAGKSPDQVAAIAREFLADADRVVVSRASEDHRVALQPLDAEFEWRDGAGIAVVAAGREGALATVVAGLVDGPVIGPPVSVGYGHGGDGEAALSSTLQSCAVLSTVNIDAGVVAGAQAAQIARPD